jgi:hypothetical protein
MMNFPTQMPPCAGDLEYRGLEKDTLAGRPRRGELMKRFGLALALATLIVSVPAFAATNGISADHSKGVLLLGSPAGAANCKAATTGAIRYNSATPAIEFCNGTVWTVLYQVQSAPAITAPAASGYFVLSHGTYNGNFGGLSAADSTCLTNITTNTGWLGYATANSNGQLTADKVHVFLCESGACNNLMPLTTYFFANALNSAAGGASFTTNSNGFGPGDSNNWAAANYFSGSYIYWTGRYYTSSTQWATDTGISNFCGTWNSNGGGGGMGQVGVSGYTDQNRWSSAAPNCGNTLHLICSESVMNFPTQMRSVDMMICLMPSCAGDLEYSGPEKDTPDQPTTRELKT